MKLRSSPPLRIVRRPLVSVGLFPQPALRLAPAPLLDPPLLLELPELEAAPLLEPPELEGAPLLEPPELEGAPLLEPPPLELPELGAPLLLDPPLLELPLPPLLEPQRAWPPHGR